MSERAQILRADHLGGMSQRRRAPIGKAHEIADMRRTARGTWGEAGGFVAAISGSMSAYHPVHSLHWFGQHGGGQQWLVLDTGDDDSTIRWVDFRNGTGPALRSGRVRRRGPDPGPTWIEHGNWLYCIDGLNEPFRWNGRAIVRAGFDGPPPPPELEVGPFDEAVATTYPDEFFDQDLQRGVGGWDTGADVNWTYGYRLTWLNDRGMESPPSPMVLISGTNPRVVPTGSPDLRGMRSVLLSIADAPEHVVGIRIYRTVNLHDVAEGTLQGQPVYLHTELPHGHALRLCDDKQDNELGSQFSEDAVGVWPSGMALCAMFKGCLFGSGAPGSPAVLHYSRPGRIEQFPASNTLHVGSASAGPITGLKATRDALVVFRARGVYLVRGSPPNGFRVDPLTEDVGCLAPRAIFEVPDRGLLFLSERGPHLLMGALENSGTPTRVEYIGGEIAEVWEREVNTKALLGARGSVYARDGEIWLLVPADGDDRLRLGLVLHTGEGIDLWSVRRGYPFSALAETRDHRNLLYAGSWDGANHEGLWVYTRGGDKNGTARAPKFVSSWVDLGERSLVRHLELEVVDNQLGATATWAKDHDALASFDFYDAERSMADAERDRPVWGTARWGTGVWHEDAPTIVRYDPRVADANAFSFRWSLEGGEHLEVHGFDLVVKPHLSDVRKRPPRGT